jgi:hypothetical protein
MNTIESLSESLQDQSILISTQVELIEKLERAIAEMQGRMGLLMSEKAAAEARAFELSQALAAQVPAGPQWISINDRLPELHTAVALLNDGRWMNTGGDFNINWQGAGWLCEFGSKFWSVIGGNSVTLESVTHWLPLPPPPAQSAEKESGHD